MAINQILSIPPIQRRYINAIQYILDIYLIINT